MLPEGSTAPDFVLPGIEDGEPTRYELFRSVEADRSVLLLFYPATFLPTATAELHAIEAAGWHEHPDLEVWVLTGDSIYAAAAYADRHDLSMAFLGDANGAAAQYDLVLQEWEGHYDVPGRGVVLVDSEWEIAYARERENAFDRSDPSPPELVAPVLREVFSGITTDISVRYKEFS